MAQLPVWLGRIPPVTRNLIIINVLIWLVEFLTGSFGDTLENILGLHFWGAERFNPVQLITYMFLHDNRSILHIAFNMFTLWMFGRILEQVWGSRRFLIYYFVCGIGAALVQEIVWQFTWQHEYIDSLARLNGITFSQMKAAIANAPTQALQGMEMMKNALLTVGASGAVFGLLLGFACVFPDMPMYLFFIPVPIKAKYMVIGYGVLEFFLGISGAQASVAHFAHLGGLLFGLIMILYWRHKGNLHGGNKFFY
ncbi:MAG: rhomboid family intramembrane serine protease [Muribaculaceae bacterium]|nr:rhomboid family intramembrane serine protease [Muribaculaceae bacterium]